MKSLLLSTLAFLVITRAAAGESLTYEDLIRRLTDMRQLATLPEPGEACAQWSSYDRRSVYDPETGQYLHWSANGDGTGYIREEGNALVLAEMDGPGVIWRIWSASADQGHVRIYLDGAETPAIDQAFINYFDGTHEPFTRPVLCYCAARGFNCYVPIPYAKSCKITADKNWGVYFHYTYTTFPENTKVPTYSAALATKASDVLDQVNTQLTNLGTSPYGADAEARTITKPLILAPNTQETFAMLQGEGAIMALRVTGDLADRMLLREVVLRITWDGATHPSVVSPLGDFFGSAPGLNPYKSLPMGMSDEGFYAYWYMPFSNGAEVTLSNDGPRTRQLTMELTHVPLKAAVKPLGRFHACWHGGRRASPERPIDWVFLETVGRGRFCGLALTIWNPMGGWWGEGDEKIFVDGEKFPSTFGTGSEDYFGYAWCNPETFAQAFHSQSLGVAKNSCAYPDPVDSGGYTANNRWHIADNIPFQKRFEGTIEKYFEDNRPTRYSCTVYWYQETPATLPGLPPVADRTYQLEAKEEMLLTFTQDAQTFAAGDDASALHKNYENLMDNELLKEHRRALSIRMARVEQLTGNATAAEHLMAPYVAELTKPFIQREFADEVLVVLGANKEAQPLIVDSGDGSIKRVQIHGRWAIRTSPNDSRPFIYFDVPGRFDMSNKDCEAIITVTYWADSPSASGPGLEYDSHFSDEVPGKYHPADPDMTPDKPGWHTVSFRCPRARFAGRQNSRADFRIAMDSPPDLYVCDVSVKMVDGQ